MVGTARRSGIFDVVQLTGEPPAADRRAAPRVPIDVGVSACVGTRRWSVRLIDVSSTGALLEHLDHPAPAGVHALWLGADQPRLRLLVQTVWRGARRYAVRFLALDDAQRLELAEALDRVAHGPLHAHGRAPLRSHAAV